MIVVTFLLFGALIGAFARAILPGRQDLNVSTTIIVGLLGAGTVGAASSELLGQWHTWQGPSLVGSVLGASLFVVLAEGINRRMQIRAQRRPTAELVEAGESGRVEFKSSARFNHHTGDKDARIELAIARSVAGLANADGGTLLVGVDDDGRPVGLEHDLRLVKGGDLDRYELWLHDLLERCLGRGVLTHVQVSFDRLDGADVARLDVAAAETPVYLHPHTGDRGTKFHVRTGNSTREFTVDEAVDYIATNWPQGTLARTGRNLRRSLRRWSENRRDP